ncbi:MAG: restriction endonuclease [Candidatus Aenigmatarchaeota archaeon]
MIKLEEIEKLVAEGEDIEDVLKIFGWKEFEEVVSEILERNGFKVKKNFRFKVDRKYEVDILAYKGDLVLCIDCKKWSSGRYKKSGIRKSVELNEKRVKALKEFLGEKFRASRFLSLIVTLLDEDLVLENKTLIIPIYKLNSFLLEVESFNLD